MPHTLFTEEDFKGKSKVAPWKKRVVKILESKEDLKSLKIVPATNQQTIRFHDPKAKNIEQMHMFLNIKTYGVFCGFYIKKGLTLGPKKDELMNSEWSWPVLLHLLATSPNFRRHFEIGFDAQKMGFRLEGGPKKDFIYRATIIDWGSIMSVVNSWPINMNCDVYFEKFYDRKRTMEQPDDILVDSWLEIFQLVLPIYQDILNFSL